MDERDTCPMCGGQVRKTGRQCLDCGEPLPSLPDPIPLIGGEPARRLFRSHEWKLIVAGVGVYFAVVATLLWFAARKVFGLTP